MVRNAYGSTEASTAQGSGKVNDDYYNNGFMSFLVIECHSDVMSRFTVLLLYAEVFIPNGIRASGTLINS